MVTINIKSVLLVPRFAVPAIRESSGHRSIINLSHTAALNGVPGTSLPAATRGALLNMTRDMAIQGQREGFRVNCVCVGSTFVPVIPSLKEEHSQRPIAADELAATFVYLASDDSRHVCGHVLIVDNGMHAWRRSTRESRPSAGSVSQQVPHPKKRLWSGSRGYMDGEVALITAGGGGAVANTATLAAVIGRHGSPAYGTGKSGVLALTRAMAADYFRQCIRANAVCPSGTEPAMYSSAIAARAGHGTALGQALEKARQSDQGLSAPQEIAPAYLFLASDQLSRKVTGHILMIDSGFSMMRL